MPTIKAVIFDLDDTLYPERAYAFSGFASVAAAFQDRLGDPGEATAKMQRLFDTAHRPRVFNALLAERGLPEDVELIQDMIDAYRAHDPTITLYADADTALTRLRSRYKLGLLTDGWTVAQWAKIDALALRTRVDEIVVTSELGPAYGKPHPYPFELMATRLARPPQQCAYVADNPAKDFVGPGALGWTTIQIIRPDGIYCNVPPAPGGRPDHVVDTLNNLDTVLE